MGKERQASKKFYNKCSENSRSQIVFRTDIFRKLRLVPLFIERYYDTKRDKVSYNYRIVYSSCDRPLTHLQSAEMQNLLRKKLLNCEFQLYLYNSGYGAARLHGYGASRATYYGLTCLRA